MGAKIIDRGRGPEIEGTRITVYDVMDYLKEGRGYDQIAGLFRAVVALPNTTDCAEHTSGREDFLFDQRSP